MTAILSHITMDTGSNPQHSIIWLHGLGADGQDFVPIVEEIHLPVAVRYIFPHAPHRPVTINGGFVMRAWYDIVSDDIGARQDAEGVRVSQTQIEALIAQEVVRGIKPENIFLAGFSQGGAVALHTAIRQNVKLAGVLVLSAYLPLADKLASEATPISQQTPIFMAHGRNDPIVPCTLGIASRAALLASGYLVDWHDYPMEHTVSAQELRDIQSWLKARLVDMTKG
jgi:phospholipase/carboxylesterase